MLQLHSKIYTSPKTLLYGLLYLFSLWGTRIRDYDAGSIKFQYLHYSFQDINLFEKHNVNEILVINMICVAPIASGRNLALKMIQWTENLSKNQNIPLLTAETTGIASAKTFEKCGFSNIKELEYNNYVTSNGERPLANLEPNISCIIWEKINII